MQSRSLGITYRLLDRLNRLFCRVMYRVTPRFPRPLPEGGPVLLVSDHSSFSDPMVLAATAGRPIIFLTAREVYQHSYLRWLCQTLHCIPVSRGTNDFRALRSMLRVLGQSQVVGIFPEGGLDEYREERGHQGVGYLALKTGAPVVPVSIAWGKVRPAHLVRSLITPGRAIARYGTPIILQPDPNPDRKKIGAVTTSIMRAIRELRNQNGP